MVEYERDRARINDDELDEVNDGTNEILVANSPDESFLPHVSFGMGFGFFVFFV